MSDHSTGEQFIYWIGNGASAGAVVTSLLGWLPPVAAFIAFVWYCIQIYESSTVQKWLFRRRLRKLTRLREEVAEIETRHRGEKSDDRP